MLYFRQPIERGADKKEQKKKVKKILKKVLTTKKKNVITKM